MNVTGGLLTDVPPASETLTSTTPVPGGETAVIVVVEVTTTSVACVKPKRTSVVASLATKLVPVMVTGVPPASGPWLGTIPFTDAMVGASS